LEEKLINLLKNKDRLLKEKKKIKKLKTQETLRNSNDIQIKEEGKIKIVMDCKKKNLTNIATRKN